MAPPAGATVADRGRPRPYRRLRSIDQMYLALETRTTPMHFGALVTLDGRTLFDDDGRLRLTDLRRRIADRLSDAPELRRRIHVPGPLAGAPLWFEDADLRIERHVGEARLPPGAADDAAMFRFVERLMAPTLDRAHPLWRLWFVTGLPDRRVAVLFEIHHALADGLGAMRLARTLLTEPAAAEGPADEGVAAARPRPIEPVGPTPWPVLVLDHARAVAEGARQLAGPNTRHALRDAWRSFLDGWSATRREPPAGLNEQVGGRRRLAVLRLDASAAKRIARSHGAGVNDVILDLVAGGLRALLAARGRPVAWMTPRAGIAVGLPPSARGGDAGNHFGSYVVPLPIGEPDPAARLRLVARERERAMRTQDVSGVTGVRVWTNRFPPTREFMAHQRYINVMETLIPGPPGIIELLGAPVLDLVPIQPLGRNVGLTCIASTYAGRLTIAIRADPDRFPDLDLLLDAMEREWQLLSERVPIATPAGPARITVPA